MESKDWDLSESNMHDDDPVAGEADDVALGDDEVALGDDEDEDAPGEEAAGLQEDPAEAVIITANTG